MTLQGLLYEDDSALVFLLLTIAIGGAAAALAGRAVAQAWRPWWHAVPFALMIAAAVRFLHFALFGGTLMSLQFFAVDAAFCLACALIGFRLKRVAQMVGCYGWINQRAGWAAWRRRDTAAHN